jgi:hypothetical protein
MGQQLPNGTNQKLDAFALDKNQDHCHIFAILLNGLDVSIV